MDEWRKVDKIFAQIEPTLLDHIGMLVAIDPTSGDYFLGKTATEACILAQQKHPGKLPYLKRVGFKTAYRIGAFGR